MKALGLMKGGQICDANSILHIYMVEGNLKKHPANLDFVEAKEAKLMAVQKVEEFMHEVAEKLPPTIIDMKPYFPTNQKDWLIMGWHCKFLIVTKTRKNVLHNSFQITKMLRNCDFSWLIRARHFWTRHLRWAQIAHSRQEKTKRRRWRRRQPRWLRKRGCSNTNDRKKSAWFSCADSTARLSRGGEGGVTPPKKRGFFSGEKKRYTPHVLERGRFPTARRGGKKTDDTAKR